MLAATRQATGDLRSTIADLAAAIVPGDALEAQHIADTQAWIAGGAPIWRVKKPDTPPQHLVSYFVLFDAEAQKLLLVDHKKSGLWLPAGGHVEPNEHPATTVVRECREELLLNADFWHLQPQFLTITETVNMTPNHTDVCFWYVLKGSVKTPYCFDPSEFNAIRWFGFDDVPANSDPHMRRFIGKLSKIANA